MKLSSAMEPYPAGLNRWIARYTGKNRTAYPPAWRHQLGPLRQSTPARIAVVVHVFYEDLLGELLRELANLDAPFDLIITNATGHPINVSHELSLARSTHTFDVPNHGRDILPLVMLINAGVLDGYELVLKIHTKKSQWRSAHGDLLGDGEKWRASFLSELLGSTDNVSAILRNFEESPNLGIVTSDGNLLGADFWGGDREISRALLRRLELDLDVHELQFAAGSMYWIRAFVLQGLFALHLSPEDFEEEAGQVDGTTAHALERMIGVLAREAGFHLRERSQLGIAAHHPRSDHWHHAARVPRARVIPFYLPQFHSFAENDLWWGEGFTEWSNVASAQPVFRGHRQPFLPSALGFYNLANPTTRSLQYAEAKAVGIEGFLYYYYWFAGRTIMGMPVQALHASDDDHPFCLMWANENWSRRWDGSSEDVLIGQDYDHVPASQFIRDIADLLRDPRYIRIDGRPLIAVYRITQIPNFRETIAEWRTIARDVDIGELHILSVDVGVGMDGLSGDPIRDGLNGSLEFPPHNTHWEFADLNYLDVDPRLEGRIMSYDVTIKSAETRLRYPIEEWRNPGVMVGFDNTARRQWMPDIWYGSNAYSFRRWLDIALSAIAHRSPSRRILFINAWNEWAESAVLEPSARHGRTYLLALRDALMR
jgi:lipopolysaccharide biosynthesis protein